MRANSNITVYLKDGDDYTRVTINDVHWENSKGANVSRTGLLEADTFTVYIPFAKYASPLKAGDVIVRGIVNDDPTSPTFRIGDLRKTYEEVGTVRVVDKNDYGTAALRHWRIGAN